ncbi:MULTISPECIES: arginine/lysine/ornithine decarboxylase [Rhizobium]|uniref:arginine/lysine/ornithine decarboxylase n=1 Tax=Rhizobium TaxID=379 RepID=UPI001B32EB53|nr:MULTISPECIES: arginine/lysine/ornithine decarboxylase [Rhizobium]MBX4908448.1 arginine/lysine/ornithine decarboxylase [Rhizobium bangladeshense]MBX5214452.1 arginine/lysine/ornithine decarboxylase [Rhizobium sp. NLR9a]MBX5222246.1 arginine/lysine/ornithine decarboxylase [Rhizobium sp. NLR8a]MBX5233665.1 arginine/lysine/ornithine decarboxylase [Rhizobium sp. NLR4a]MBX5245706.1 arginine/lysine/ornithine decarboxylase [Rhizobium sp. NLR3b]
MEFQTAFPIAVIDEDFDGKSAAGRGMRDLAAAIEREGFRIVSGVSYEDARRLVHVFNTESCWLVSVDGTEDKTTRWQVLGEVLAAKRQRNDRLPIFLFGDDTTAEDVPTAVLRHANAFFRLFEDSAEFMARAIAQAARNYLERLPPPMFKALMDYTLEGAYSWHTPGHGGGVAFRKSPVGQLFYTFFGENTLRSDISVSVGSVGSLLDHVGPIAEGERNAARIFGTDETFFVVGGTSTANKIVWHGMVARGDLVLCDRNCHKSILHSLIMTGATPIYLTPSRNGLGIIGPISKDQFTPESIAGKIAASPFAGQTSGKVRLMVITNSTYDGLCYNVDAIKASLGDAVEVLHFDEAWYAYANFHEFYDGFHAISSNQPARSQNAITFATQSTHKLLAALSQASMIHIQHAETKRLDITRFNEAFMMHTSTSPQYGIIASCDVAAAMMEQPAGRALIQETIDEAISFRRAMNAVRKQTEDTWWFDVWEPTIAGQTPTDTRADWVLKPDDAWHGFAGLAENHVMVDPIKVTILSPGLSASGVMDDHGIPAAVVTKFLSSRRIEIEKTGLYSFLVLFSMGITRGKWSTLVTELLNFKDLYDANAPLTRALPALAAAHPEAYAGMGLKDLCEQIHAIYRKDDVPKAQREMYTVLPDMALRPADAYDRLVKGRIESVEIDDLMNRILAVMIVPYPPGIPLIMPGERITQSTKSIQDYLLYARDFDRKFPGFETDIHGLRFAPGDGGRRYLVDCIAGEGQE